MSWRADHADTIEALELAAKRKTGAARAVLDQQLAAIYAKQPERDYAAARCIMAWYELDTCRSIGMVVGPIPVTAIHEWCAAEGIDRDGAALVKAVIRHLDIEHIRRERAKQRLASKGGPT